MAVDRAAHAPVLPLDLALPARTLALTVARLGEQHPKLLQGEGLTALVTRANGQADRAEMLAERLHMLARSGALDDAAQASIDAAQHSMHSPRPSKRPPKTRQHADR